MARNETKERYVSQEEVEHNSVVKNGKNCNNDSDFFRVSLTKKIGSFYRKKYIKIAKKNKIYCGFPKNYCTFMNFNSSPAKKKNQTKIIYYSLNESYISN